MSIAAKPAAFSSAPLPSSTVLTPQQLADRWQLDIKSIYDLIRSRQIPTVGPLAVGLRRPVYRISLSWVLSEEQGRVANGGR